MPIEMLSQINSNDKANTQNENFAKASIICNIIMIPMDIYVLIIGTCGYVRLSHRGE